MGERADEIEEQINRSRGDLNENLTELEEKVKSAFDWRSQFNERPLTMLALAFSGGLIASALLPSRPSRRFPPAAATTEPQGKLPKPAQNGRSVAKPLQNALMTVAASTLGGVLGDFVRAYRSELHKAT